MHPARTRRSHSLGACPSCLGFHSASLLKKTWTETGAEYAKRSSSEKNHVRVLPTPGRVNRVKWANVFAWSTIWSQGRAELLQNWHRGWAVPSLEYAGAVDAAGGWTHFLSARKIPLLRAWIEESFSANRQSLRNPCSGQSARGNGKSNNDRQRVRSLASATLGQGPQRRQRVAPQTAPVELPVRSGASSLLLPRNLDAPDAKNEVFPNWTSRGA
jgi:hypothetical protein